MSGEGTQGFGGDTPVCGWGSPVPRDTLVSFAGNAALVLPGAETALVPLLVAELSGEGGALPPGLLNVVTGAPDLRRALRAHPHIAAVTFLGAHQVWEGALPHGGGGVSRPGDTPLSPMSPYQGAGHGRGCLCVPYGGAGN